MATIDPEYDLDFWSELHLKEPDHSRWKPLDLTQDDWAAAIPTRKKSQRREPKARGPRDAGIPARKGILVMPDAKITTQHVLWVLTRAPRFVTEEEVQFLLTLLGRVDVKKHGGWMVKPAAATIAEDMLKKSEAMVLRRVKSTQAKRLLVVKRGRSSSLMTLDPGAIVRCVGDRELFDFLVKVHILAVRPDDWPGWNEPDPEAISRRSIEVGGGEE